MENVRFTSFQAAEHAEVAAEVEDYVNGLPDPQSDEVSVTWMCNQFGVFAIVRWVG